MVKPQIVAAAEKFHEQCKVELTDNVQVYADGGRAETVGRFARIATGVGRLDVADVEPRARSLDAESLPAEMDAVRVLGPRDERTRIAVDRTRDAYSRADLNDQRRRVLRFDLWRLRSCTS